MEIELLEYKYHRNGVGGQGFHSFRFWWNYENGTRARFIATIFPSLDSRGRECDTLNGLVCVLMEEPYGAVSLTDTWRGDYVEPTLRRFLVWRERNRSGAMLDAPTLEQYNASSASK